jgi:GNAT superfamily N-acetyltransferase
MAMMIREVGPEELEAVIPALRLAEPSLRALRWSLENLSDGIYRLDADGELCGAATMRWRDEPCEIIELAIVAERQGQGLGRAFIQWLAEESRQRGHRAMIVGTSTTSADNIVFYQKCGFRADSIRPDYFWYLDTPEYENGLLVRDMIVFRMELG